MSIDDFNEEELNSIQLQMSSFVDDDIPEENGHRIVSSSLEDWEQPNQVVCLEA